MAGEEATIPIPHVGADSVALAQHLLDLKDLAAQEAMARWAEYLFYVGILQVLLAITGTIALIVTIRQTRVANRIAQEASVRGHRAWITTKLVLEGPLQWTSLHDDSPLKGTDLDEDRVGVLVKIHIKNTGPTPALNVHTSVKLAFEINRAREIVREFSEPNRVRDEHAGRLCLPGESYYRDWHASGAKDDIAEMYRQIGNCNVLVIGCVSYEIQGDVAVHQTQFSYLLNRRDDGEFNIGSDVPVGKLTYKVWSGAYAD